MFYVLIFFLVITNCSEPVGREGNCLTTDTEEASTTKSDIYEMDKIDGSESELANAGYYEVEEGSYGELFRESILCAEDYLETDVSDYEVECRQKGFTEEERAKCRVDLERHLQGEFCPGSCCLSPCPEYIPDPIAPLPLWGRCPRVWEENRRLTYQPVGPVATAWFKMSGWRIPRNAIQHAKTSKGESVYYGRCRNSCNELRPGKVIEDSIIYQIKI